MISDYLTDVLDRRKRTDLLARAEGYLYRRTDEFDTIAFQGISGALVAPVLADRLNKHLLVVRKSEDGYTHSQLHVEGVYGKRIVIVDDFIVSGRTISHVLSKLRLETDRRVRVQLHRTDEYFPGLRLVDNPDDIPRVVAVFLWRTDLGHSTHEDRAVGLPVWTVNDDVTGM